MKPELIVMEAVLQAARLAQKRKHPYPGGWRTDARSTPVEDAAAKARAAFLASESLAPSSLDQEHVMLHSDLEGYPDCIEIGGELFARPSWINKNLRAVESAFEIFSRAEG